MKKQVFLFKFPLRKMLGSGWSRCFLLTFGLLLQGRPFFGQSAWKGWQLDAAINSGHISRHTNKLTISNSQRVFGAELNFNYQTWGKQGWNYWRHFPQMGCAFILFELGEGAHGRAIGLLPNISMPLFFIKNMGFHLRFGTGLVAVSRPFDYQTNPIQNAIGSKWNNAVQFRFGTRWLAKKKHFSAEAGISFTHFSNGGTRRPNYGLNIPAFYLTTGWTPNPPKSNEFIDYSTSKKGATQKWGGDAHVGFALGEVQVEDGPLFPIYSASIAVRYSLNELNHVLSGLDWELHTPIQYFLAHAGNQLDEKLTRQQATRWMVFLGDEILFGKIGTRLQTGVYLGRNRAKLIPLFFFNKLSVRYYFRKIACHFKPWCGVYMKSHRATAEYLSLNLGFSF